jgi:uncharacterized repeat protein (TIGR01451 family)
MERGYRNPERFHLWLLLIGAVVFLLLVGLASPAGALAPPPRPTLDPGAPPRGGRAEPDGDEDEEYRGPPKYAVVRGVVVNWGYHDEPGVNLRLGNGGWELTQVTSDDGRYLFGPLGGGMATLRLNLPEDAPLQAAVREVVLQTTGEYSDDIVANFALYSGQEKPRPPAHLTVTATPTNIWPGDRVTFELKIQNDLPNGISKVKVLHLMPWELITTEVQGVEQDSVMICNDPVNKHVGRLVTVNLGEVAQGAVKNLKIVATLDEQAAPGVELEARSTLLYAESIMDQQVVKLNTGEQLPLPPVRLTMTVSPTQVRPGGRVKYTISVGNGLPYGISQVIVSDMLPQGLGSIEATTTRGSVDVLERLVTANVGQVAAGAVETVEILAVVDPQTGTGTKLENYATLLYAEGLAVQASAELIITGQPVAEVQATDAPLPSTLPTATTTPTPAPVAAIATPAPTVTSVPAMTSPTAELPVRTPVVPSALPVTGGEVLPFAGLALALLVLLAHRLRSRPG